MLTSVLRWAAAVAVLGIVSTLPVRAESLTPQQQKEMTELGRTALGPDAAASDRAIDALRALGEPARPRLTGVLRELLARGRTLVAAAQRRVSDPVKAKAVEADLTRLRAEAVANVARLAKNETLTIAHQNYDKLEPMLQLLNSIFEVRDAVRKVMVRRPRLLAVWQEIGGEDRRVTPDSEAQLVADAEAVLGMPLRALAEVPAFGRGDPPADPARWQYWFYDACRRTEAYNRTREPQMSAGEIENSRYVNAYREMLGILPLEIDARLLQSARRHSKEMADLGYFAHESPTEAEKTHLRRMENAGYDGGYSENIASGSGSGKSAFWQWFDSPGHHKNMVDGGSAAIGVGQWGSLWTQNFGRGRRLVTLDPAERAKAVVKGEILEPRQGGSVPAAVRTAPGRS